MKKRGEARPTSFLGSPGPPAPGTGAEPNSAEPNAAEPRLPDYIITDILAYVEQALGRFATPGRVRFHDSHLYLDGAGDGPSPQVSIEAWAGAWYNMDEATRLRRAESAARVLSQTRVAIPSGRPARRMIFVDPKLMIALGVLALCTLWIVLGEDRLPRSRATTDQESESTRAESGPPPSSREDSGEARASRVCAATLTRIFQGGSVSIADVDGFRVEIALLHAGGSGPLDTHPALARFVEDPGSATGSRFIWEKESGLASVETSDSVVVVRRTVVGEGDERIFGVTLSFGGSLVDPYFKEAERSRFFHIASTLAETLGATHSAVYARCFDRPLHVLGSWFRGPDTGGAVSALVYFMGTYARPLHLAKPYSQLPGEQDLNRLHAWSSIQEKTAPLTREDLATLIGNEGGMATGRDGEQVIITFPFGDGNRASRASRAIVRVAGLGL